MTVEPNQVIALIGTTGSGKTSPVNPIPQFYDINQGAVLVDGIDVRRVDSVTLRKHIGIVLQNSLLFSSGIRENMSFGRPDASDEEVQAAAQAVGADGFFRRLSQVYLSPVEEGGAV